MFVSKWLCTKLTYTQVVHEPGIDEEGDVEDDVAKKSHDDERFPAIVVGEGSGEECEDNRWEALDQTVVALQMETFCQRYTWISTNTGGKAFMY